MKWNQLQKTDFFNESHKYATKYRHHLPRIFSQQNFWSDDQLENIHRFSNLSPSSPKIDQHAPMLCSETYDTSDHKEMSENKLWLLIRSNIEGTITRNTNEKKSIIKQTKSLDDLRTSKTDLTLRQFQESAPNNPPQAYFPPEQNGFSKDWSYLLS